MAALLTLGVYGTPNAGGIGVELSDAQIENIIRRSYPYVAMYSVGDNAGMKLDSDGGIAIYIAAQKPKAAAEENWLPIERKDEEALVL
jgi:hypothetical protein